MLSTIPPSVGHSLANSQIWVKVSFPLGVRIKRDIFFYEKAIIQTTLFPLIQYKSPLGHSTSVM